ncbi:MAG: preprotein translocase subunit SecE [Bacillota bacterium]
MGGIIGKIGKFFRSVKNELKKVNWPNRNELSSYTLVVLITVIALISFIGIVDLIFSNIITPLIM